MTSLAVDSLIRPARISKSRLLWPDQRTPRHRSTDAMRGIQWVDIIYFQQDQGYTVQWLQSQLFRRLIFSKADLIGLIGLKCCILCPGPGTCCSSPISLLSSLFSMKRCSPAALTNHAARYCCPFGPPAQLPAIRSLGGELTAREKRFRGSEKSVMRPFCEMK